MAERSRNIELRPIESVDLPKVWEIVGNPMVAEAIFNNLQTVTQSNFVSILLTTRPGTRSVLLGAWVGTELMGVVSLNDIYDIHRSAVIGVAAVDIGKESRIWALCRVMRALCEHAFDGLNLHSLQSYCFPENKGIRSVIRRFGGELAGTLRKAVYRNGEYGDLLIFQLLKENWIRN